MVRGVASWVLVILTIIMLSGGLTTLYAAVIRVGTINPLAYPAFWLGSACIMLVATIIIGLIVEGIKKW